MTISEFSKGYLCGIIDGEGTVGVYSKPGSGLFRACIFIYNKNKQIIKRVLNILRSLSIRNSYYTDSRGVIHLQIEHKNASKLAAIVGKSLVKNKQAAAVAAFNRTVGVPGQPISEKMIGRRRRLYIKTLKLNKKGKAA